MGSEAADRQASAQAGVVAGLAGLATFLALHHLWIVPIWFIAPVGVVIAALGGAAVGVAYADVRPHLPPPPLAPIGVAVLAAAILAPSIVIAQVAGSIYTPGAGGRGELLVPPGAAIAAVVLGLLGTSTLAGAMAGALLGRSVRATGSTALAGLLLALGPGHNVPFFGGTPSATKELAILAMVTAVSSVALVLGHSRLAAGAAIRDGTNPGVSVPD